jgi:23S rRNA-/tRNA-specific pseudouridylate synthase
LYNRKVNFIVPVFRTMLHAHSLVFVHPVLGEKMRVVAKVPRDMQELMGVLFAG